MGDPGATTLGVAQAVVRPQQHTMANDHNS